MRLCEALVDWMISVEILHTHILNILRFKEDVDAAESELCNQNEEYHDVPMMKSVSQSM